MHVCNGLYTSTYRLIATGNSIQHSCSKSVNTYVSDGISLVTLGICLYKREYEFEHEYCLLHARQFIDQHKLVF